MPKKVLKQDKLFAHAKYINSPIIKSLIKYSTSLNNSLNY